jgi:hypothetical protein
VHLHRRWALLLLRRRWPRAAFVPSITALCAAPRSGRVRAQAALCAAPP